MLESPAQCPSSITLRAALAQTLHSNRRDSTNGRDGTFGQPWLDSSVASGTPEHPKRNGAGSEASLARAMRLPLFATMEWQRANREQSANQDRLYSSKVMGLKDAPIHAKRPREESRRKCMSGGVAKKTV